MPWRVYDLEFDDDNTEELARHSVSIEEAFQVLDGRPRFFRNKRPHATAVIMVGPTSGGRLLTLPLAETPVAGLWRPASGWDSSPGERARYEAARGG